MHCLVAAASPFRQLLGFCIAAPPRRRRNFIFDETSELSDYLCVLSKHKTASIAPAASRPSATGARLFRRVPNLRSAVFARGVTRFRAA